MKMHQMSVRRNSGQTGFTLIELIVVIVILGILAATALPKFAGLGADARLASLNAAKGSLRGTIQMAHAQYLANTSGTPLIGYTSEGVTSKYTLGVYYLGYPVAGDTVSTTATSNIVAMAGLTSADYTILANGTATATNATTIVPAVGPGQVVIIPNSVAGTPAALTCFITYTQPTILTAPGSGSAPTLGVVSDVPGFVNASASSDGTNPC